MSHEITIQVPVVILDRVGLTLARPLSLADCVLAGASPRSALSAVRRHLLNVAKKLTATELVHGSVIGDVRSHVSVVHFKPPRELRHSWRADLVIPFDYFVWDQANALQIAYVPALELSIPAMPRATLDELVEEQIRATVRRRGLWTLESLSHLKLVNDLRLSAETLSIIVKSPLEQSESGKKRKNELIPTLRSVATRLRRSEMSLAYERDAIVHELADRLAATPTRSILMVGPAGVGKTAIFHEFVRRRGDSDVGLGKLAKRPCYATDGSRIISGQSGFGMWQQRCVQLAQEAQLVSAIVHLGNLAELSESGRNYGSGGCGSVLAARLAEGSLQAVIECTAEQYDRVARVEPRLVAALSVLRVEEPTPAEVRSILLECAATWRPHDVSAELKQERLKRRQSLSRNRAASKSAIRSHARAKGSQELPTVEPEALVELDRLHRRFHTDAAAPGRPLAFFQNLMSEMQLGETLTAAKVIDGFGRQTGLPQFLINDAVRPDLEKIEQSLRSQILGQDEVIHTLVDLIATVAADLSRSDRPLASLFLIGPTGVGKTETAKALTRLIYSDTSRLVRMDMSEYGTPMAVGRLIGDSIQGEGVLTSAVRAQPFSLLLLDEIEKADAAVFDLLLQVLGEGRLTDGQGRLADFRNSIIIMTSNLGVDSFRATSLGLAETQPQVRYQNHFEKRLRGFLRPEMYNRLDRILCYRPLPKDVIESITQTRLEELNFRDGWTSPNPIRWEKKVITRLAELGYQPQYGARPLVREVTRHVITPLAEAICNHGRNQPVTALLGTRTNSQNETGITVNVHRQVKSNRDIDVAIHEVLNRLTGLRRQGQSLRRCNHVMKMRNLITMRKRRLKYELRRAKGNTAKGKLRASLPWQELRILESKMDCIEQLVSEIERAETVWWSRNYRGKKIDVTVMQAQSDALYRRLWDLLCELQLSSDSSRDRMTLVFWGDNLSIASELFEGYRELVRSHAWNLQVHSLILRSNLTDERLDAPGWATQPAFRISVRNASFDDTNFFESASFADVLPPVPNSNESLPKNDLTPRLAAHRMESPGALSALPQRISGLMLTFRGKYAAQMMSGEAGIHSFIRSRARNDTIKLVVEPYRDLPVRYLAPDPNNPYYVISESRRVYDLEQQLMMELNEDSTRWIKMDRARQWLHKSIQTAFEARVWKQLEDEG